MSLDTSHGVLDTLDPMFRPATAARFPRHQDLAVWLQGLGPAAPDMRRLLPLIEGLWNPAERLALHQALWHAWAVADADQRQAARCLHDGRYAGWCEQFNLPWAAPLTTQWLARAHLRDAETVPELALRVPADPAYVRHLLRAMGADERKSPWKLLSTAARLADRTEPLDAATCRALAEELRTDLAQGRVLWGEALALLFGLAVHAGDEVAALDVLVRGLSDTRPVPWPARALRRWLEGTGDPAHGPDDVDVPPLQLAGELQACWLVPARLGDPAWRARLADSIRRPAVLARLQALDAALPADRRAAVAVPERSASADTRAAWLRLKALDSAYALADQGRLTLAQALPLMGRGFLSRPAIASLSRTLALQHLERGDVQVACAGLAWARAAGCPRARNWLADLLATLAPVKTATLVGLLRAGSTGALHSEECQAWAAMAEDADAGAVLNTVARGMLARAATEGALERRAPGRQQDAPRALAAWQSLADDPDLAAEAAVHLQRGALADLAQWWVSQGAPLDNGLAAREHLWVPPREAPPPGHRRLWIVLSCVDTLHTYTQVNALAHGLPHDHLLFVNNPEFNWYGDAAFESLQALVAQRVSPAFAPSQVVCYFGSMGGHGALKLALQHGFRAIVFNPQTDLDAWAAFRPGERERLWGVTRHRALGEGLNAAAWGRAPTYMTVGSGTADREAFSAWVDCLRGLPEGRFIVEKFPDVQHAALIRRICPGPVPVMLALTAARLDAMAADDAPPERAQAVAAGDEPVFWDRLDAARSVKIEIWLRGGRVWHAPSQGTGTRA